MTASEDPATPAPPVLRIVRGEPDAVELAALVAVITAAAAGADDEEEPAAPAASHWAPPERLLRPAVQPTGWWASSLPR